MVVLPLRVVSASLGGYATHRDRELASAGPDICGFGDAGSVPGAGRSKPSVGVGLERVDVLGEHGRGEVVDVDEREAGKARVALVDVGVANVDVMVGFELGPHLV